MKIALILPESRVLRWHAVLAGQLAQKYQVDVFTTRSRPFPLILRLYLALERALFRSSRLADPIRIGVISKNAKDYSLIPNLYHDVVVNLGADDCDTILTPQLALRFDGSRSELDLIGRLLRHQNPAVSVTRTAKDSAIICSYLAIDDRTVLARALASVFARSISLLLRAIDSTLEQRHYGQLTEKLPIRMPLTYSGLALVRFASGTCLTKISRYSMSPFLIAGHWSIAIKTGGQSLSETEPTPNGYRYLSLPTEAFYADPFLYHECGRTFLFAEKLEYSKGRGVIVCAPVSPTGTVGSFETVLERPYHLSYPFIFEHGGIIYMMPETLADRTLQLYRCIEFPYKWRFDSIIKSDVALSDATLLRHDDKWWIFATTQEFGGSTQDELVAYYAESLQGPWLPHRLNPLISDCRFARPAGRFLVRGQRLLRPAQDCEQEYGAGLAWREVRRLTPDEYAEVGVGRWCGSDFGPAIGVHTYSAAAMFEAVDLRIRAPKNWWFRRRTLPDRVRGSN